MIPLDLLGLPRAPRAVPPPEPPLAEVVTVHGTWQPVPGCTYVTARSLRPPRWPDPVVFGPEPSW